MIKVEVEYDDIVIKRVSNGWIVISEHDTTGGHMLTSVYSDDDSERASAKALMHLLRDQFCDYMQVKKWGGLNITINEKGWSYEEGEQEGECGIKINIDSNEEWQTTPQGEQKIQKK